MQTLSVLQGIHQSPLDSPPKSNAIIYISNELLSQGVLEIKLVKRWEQAVWRSLGTNFSEIFSEIHTNYIQENAFENVICEMAAILSGPQCVKCQMQKGYLIPQVTWHLSVKARLIRISQVRISYFPFSTIPAAEGTISLIQNIRLPILLTISQPQW